MSERAGNLFAPDTLLATQYFDRVRRRKDMTGEQRLICAVMESAVETYQKHATATLRLHRDLFDEAERWIESQDRSSIYTFETICDYLGLESDYLRRGLRAWKARARGEQAAQAEAPSTPIEPADRPLAMNE